ncbi:hypothetical protein CDAR_269421 [Caerostris darwini]|uniref:Uncharacterized protein n=1 Tax=Caerostris darwini TaxID=1538125 RepID=A0AAV4VQB4_9ARAC|nr:hypothetical protein CDAR_269421 [Caerostris darwini]
MPLFHLTTSSKIPPSRSRQKHNRQTNHLIHGDETDLRQHRKNGGEMRCGNKLPSTPTPKGIVWSRDLTTCDVIALTICSTLRESNERQRKDAGRISAK